MHERDMFDAMYDLEEKATQGTLTEKEEKQLAWLRKTCSELEEEMEREMESA